jgi:hypothetical protein
MMLPALIFVKLTDNKNKNRRIIDPSVYDAKILKVFS